MTGRRVRRLVTTTTVVMALGLAGCGVGTEARPVPVAPDEVPFGLLRELTTASTTTTTTAPTAPAT